MSYFSRTVKSYKRGLNSAVFSFISGTEKADIKSVASFMSDGDWIESKDQTKYGIRLIQTGNIGNGVFIDKEHNARYISPNTYNRLHCTEVCSGDILVSRLPSPAGRACILPTMQTKCITAVDCTIIRVNNKTCVSGYLLQFLKSDGYFNTVESFLAGGTRQRISRKNLENIQIPLPTITIQNRISNILNEFDALICSTEQTYAALERMKRSLLQKMFI